MSAAMLGAQSKAQDNGKSSDAGKSGASANGATVTFTGCLSPGSKSDSYLLTNAKEKGVKGPGATVNVVPATKKVDLAPFVTQEVELSGTVDKSGTPATVTVVKVKSRADQC